MGCLEFGHFSGQDALILSFMGGGILITRGREIKVSPDGVKVW